MSLNLTKKEKIYRHIKNHLLCFTHYAVKLLAKHTITTQLYYYCDVNYRDRLRIDRKHAPFCGSRVVGHDSYPWAKQHVYILPVWSLKVYHTPLESTTFAFWFSSYLQLREAFLYSLTSYVEPLQTNFSWAEIYKGFSSIETTKMYKQLFAEVQAEIYKLLNNPKLVHVEVYRAIEYRRSTILSDCHLVPSVRI